jgi:hypothetical protein
MSTPPTFPELEEKIASLERRLARLKRARNSHIAICRLPPEILVEIFTVAQHPAADEPYDADRPWLTYDPRWSRIMLVCYYFRKLAARTPALWTVLDEHQGSWEWQRLCLVRHGNIPLFIRGNSSGAMKLLAKAQAAEMSNAFKRAYLLHTHAPELRSLKLSLFETALDAEEYQQPRSARFAITDRFMGGGSTPLASLTLHGNGIELRDAPFMATLRCLRLDSMRTAYSLEPLVALFRNTPALEELYIIDICLTEHFGSVEATEVIPVPADHIVLSELKYLSIDDTPAEASALARMLIPYRAGIAVSLTVRSWLEYDEDEDTEDEDPFETTELNDNYLAAYEAWCMHARVNGSTSVPGTISFNVPYHSHRGLQIRFESSRSTLAMTCDVNMYTDARPLFNHITILRLVWNCEQLEDPQDASFSIDALFHLLHLRMLVLVNYDLTNPSEQATLKYWIEIQPELECVHFIRCDSGTRPFMEELLAESLVGEALWSDQ